MTLSFTMRGLLPKVEYAENCFLVMRTYHHGHLTCSMMKNFLDRVMSAVKEGIIQCKELRLALTLGFSCLECLA